MSLDINLIIKKEKFIIGYSKVIDNALCGLSRRRKNKLSKSDEDILKAAWVTINRNIVWFLTNYKKSINSVPVTPISECSFACRLIMESVADCRYYLLGNEECKDYFLKEYKDFRNDFDDFWKNLGNKNYPRINGYIPTKVTMDRIESCFGKDGVGYYQILCWNTHFSRVGYEVLKNDLQDGFNYKMRISGLIYVLGSLNCLLKTLFEANILEESYGSGRMAESDKIINDLREILKNG